MRKNRVIEQNRCYHLVSRLAHRAFFLDDEEKDRAVALMRRVEAEVQDSMSYCINRTVSISPFAFQMTNKEYQVADYLRDRYFLYIVRGFETPKPFFTIVRDPITAGLDLQKHDVVSHQTFWTGDVTSGFASNCV